jgi:hypothetical protein
MRNVQRSVLGLLILIVLASLAVGETHFTFTSNTGNNAIIGIPLAVNPAIGHTPLAAGDEIGVFTPAGLCVGAVMWNGANSVAVTVWEDNAQTIAIDGIKGGELIKFRIWRQSSNTEYSNATVVYATDPTGAGTYVSMGIYVLSSLSIPVVSAIGVETMFGAIPEQYSLLNAFPNPFNPSTTIQFGLPERSIARLEIFNLLGEKLATLVDETKEAGFYRTQWTANAPSGTYLVRFEANSVQNPGRHFVNVRKLVLLK